MSTYENISVEIAGSAGIIRIARPKVFNALNNETLVELESAIGELEANESLRGIVITGGDLPVKEGKPARHSFVSGADIGMLSKQNVAQGRENSRLGQRVFARIENCSKPVVAAINGFAFGGGLELALSCHWRYASDNAELGLVEGTLGLIPGYGGTQRLARLIGKGPALELICTAARIKAEQALELGIINRMTMLEELLPAALESIEKVSACGPIAVAYAIEAVNRGLEGSQEDGMAIEADLFGIISESEDMREGCAAFLEKRKAEFKNR